MDCAPLEVLTAIKPPKYIIPCSSNEVVLKIWCSKVTSRAGKAVWSTVLIFALRSARITANLLRPVLHIFPFFRADAKNFPGVSAHCTLANKI